MVRVVVRLRTTAITSETILLVMVSRQTDANNEQAASV